MYSIKKIPVGDQVLTMITVNTPQLDISFIDYGAAIYDLQVPDKDGHKETVVLQYQNMQQYLENKRHLNASIGPTAGRIQNGVYTIDDTTIQLDQNFLKKHTLHGGVDALSYTFFDFELLEEEERVQVTFKTVKKQYFQQYPGNQEYEIVYTIEGLNITIEFIAKTDTPTVINLTNHAYFNLSGNLRSTIMNHEMQIHASTKLALDDEMIPYAVESITDTIYDYTDMQPIQKPGFPGIDDPYMLDHVGLDTIAATVQDPVSKRRLDVYTTYPCVVCYTDNFPQDDALAFDRDNVLHMGVCFETQNPPNGIYVEGVESSILRPHERYYHKTIFAFSVEE
ncbi:aldose epimerase family protein [Candidatus Xianfuyuplasma coldseepsis]|uniref:Aldose 1-epimerase n=1 Tax=Candidatus Xianfuyuplasma coldseepsis TaxID=2782163 RepID=A0A7L7KNN1_9MOLU|nr:aldose epimerase family protein [Xianfuyuplasma coldseepsis]QMS84351.1 galactose mutarotase [Xianfuyuplasma coldseepsis]